MRQPESGEDSDHCDQHLDNLTTRNNQITLGILHPFTSAVKIIFSNSLLISDFHSLDLTFRDLGFG